MNDTVLYLVGTLLGWIGFLSLCIGIISLIQAVAKDPRHSMDRLLKKAGIAGIGGAVALFVCARFTHPSGLHAPIAWIVLPFSGWLSIGALVFAGLQAVAVVGALNKEEQVQKTKNTIAWILVCVVSAYLTFAYGDPIKVLRGSVELSTATVGCGFALLVGGAALTTFAVRDLRLRGGIKAIALQVTLLAGTVVFGLPFAWLLITSFKEERDMVSTNGIIWIPRVEKQVEYFDKKNPTVEAKYQGRNVTASILETRPDGSVNLDIIKPYSLHGRTLVAAKDEYKVVPKLIPLVMWNEGSTHYGGKVIEELPDGRRRISIMSPAAEEGKEVIKNPTDVDPDRHIGLKVQNYPDALDYLPVETNRGLVYLKNTLLIVVLSVIGTVITSTMVAYAFARIRFPGRDLLFNLLLATMMLPSAVTLLPQFLIFRSLGWINTLLPIIVPTFFASAFNVFLLRQFLKQVPGELEDAAKIDGCNHGKILSKIMVPAIMPALAVISIWTFMGAWNNFMGPLIYLSTPENMPLSYALQLFQGERQLEPGLLMAFTTMTMLPVLLVFFFAQKYFVEGVTLSGLGGR